MFEHLVIFFLNKEEKKQHTERHFWAPRIMKCLGLVLLEMLLDWLEAILKGL